MNRTNNWMARLVLGGMALSFVAGNVLAQGWQPKWTSDNGATQVDWQQRVLKQPPTVPDSVPQQAATTVYQQPSAPYHVAQRQWSDHNNNASVVTSDGPVVSGRQRARWVSDEQEVIPPGTVQFDPVASDGVFAGNGCATCGGNGGECDSCGTPACGDGCDGWALFDGRCGPWIRGLSVFAGADGFKGPLDHGKNGNFGLNEGLNLSRPLGDPWGCGYQIGVNFVQSDFSGTTDMAIPTAGNGILNVRAAMRRQYFATAGLFHRADACGGFQYGVAYDYLHDIYYQNADLQQIRSESSYVIDDVYEVGYYGAYNVGTDRVFDVELNSTDMFVLFARRNFENGGDGRIWAGATANGDALLGLDLWVPLGKGLALENRINYVIPKQGRGATAQANESWGLVAQLVWYPGQNARCMQKDPFRPIFNVADNSLFMTRLAQ